MYSMTESIKSNIINHFQSKGYSYHYLANVTLTTFHQTKEPVGKVFKVRLTNFGIPILLESFPYRYKQIDNQSVLDVDGMVEEISTKCIRALESMVRMNNGSWGHSRVDRMKGI